MSFQVENYFGGREVVFKSVARTVRSAREDYELTVDELASDARVKQEDIVAIESAESWPSRAEFLRITTMLDLSIEEVLLFDEDLTKKEYMQAQKHMVDSESMPMPAAAADALSDDQPISVDEFAGAVVKEYLSWELLLEFCAPAKPLPDTVLKAQEQFAKIR